MSTLRNEKVRGDLTHAIVEVSTEDKGVYTLTPADRHNFGDLLFPIVTEKVLSELDGFAPPKHLALTKSDLSEYGAVPTESLANASPGFGHNDVLLIPGGEVLSSSWHVHLKTLGRRLRFGRSLERYGILRQERYAQWLLHGKTPQPWVVAPDDLPGHVNVAYYGVGGSALAAEASDQLPPIAERLRKAFYVSARDQDTQQALQAAMPEKEIHLTPCVVATVAKHFPIDELPCVTSLDAEFGSEPMESITGSYILVQANPHLIYGESKAELLQALDEVSAELGMPVVITVAGLAPNHNDDVLARFLFDNLTGKRVLVIRGEVEETLSLIANAALVVSTSLHFQIVANSYAVPSLVLCHGDPKVEHYVSTWTPETPRVKPNGLLRASKVALAIQKATRELRARELSRLASIGIRGMMERVSTARLCLAMLINMLTGIHGPPGFEGV